MNDAAEMIDCLLCDSLRGEEWWVIVEVGRRMGISEPDIEAARNLLCARMLMVLRNGRWFWNEKPKETDWEWFNQWD